MHFKFEFQKIDLVQWFKYKKRNNKLIANTNKFKSSIILMTMVYSYLKLLIQCLFFCCHFVKKFNVGPFRYYIVIYFKILAIVSQSGSVGHTVIQKMNLHKEGDTQKTIAKELDCFLSVISKRINDQCIKSHLAQTYPGHGLQGMGHISYVKPILNVRRVSAKDKKDCTVAQYSIVVFFRLC